MKLREKVAIVTGAAQGIGKSTAIALSREGAKVVVSDILFDLAKEVTELIRSKGGESIAIKADVSREEEVKELVRKTIDHYKKIDILINNAGISPKKQGRQPSILDISKEEWDRVLSVNLTSGFLCSREVLPHMIKQKSGAIVNISSISIKTGGFLAGSHYVASKGGIYSFTKSLAREVAPHGIRVNAIAPGRVQTQFALDSSREKNEEVLKDIPLGRFADPEDIADAVVFLSSTESRYITGITVNVSGGWVMD